MQVVAIAADQTQKLRQFKQENQLTMTLIGDMRRISLKAFKVFTWGRIKDAVYRKFAIAIPSTFLINTRGIIVWSYVGSREDRPSFDLISQAIVENLNNGQ